MLVFGGKMETGVNKLLEGTGEAIKTVPELYDDIIQDLKRRNLTIYGTTVVTKSLEDIYLDILKERRYGKIS